MKTFKYHVIEIHEWRNPITEKHSSNHKTLESAEKQVRINESKKNGNKYRIDEH